MSQCRLPRRTQTKNTWRYNAVAVGMYSRHSPRSCLFISSTCRPAVADSSCPTDTRFGPLQQAPQDSGTSCLSRVEATRTKELIPQLPKLEVAYDLDDGCHHWCPQRAQGGDLQRRSALSMADCVDTSWNWSCRELQRAFLGIPSWDSCRWGSYFGPT